MSDNIQKVIDHVQPSSFIGKFIRLKHLPNRQFVGLCPFHNEKSPSFRVNDDKKFFYCFGCHKGGNILNFLQDYKNIDFSTALQEIATEYGIKLEIFNSKTKDEEKNKQDLLLEISNLFEAQLQNSVGKEAVDYFKNKRKISNEIIKHFKLGFCPKEADFLISYFPNKIEELMSFGLIGKRENGEFYSTFNDRVIFPILNTRGNVIAFGSRIYKKSQEEIKLAKYINSKESEIFKKSKVIYGFEKMKNAKTSPIIVEGYFDVITMHQFGFTSAVAAMGTAFSEEQIAQLFNISKEIIFCYDSDDAGKKAENRSIELCLSTLTPEKNISFISLETKDCDEFLHLHGKEKMQEKINQRLPLYQKIFLNFRENVDMQNPEQASLFEEKLMKFSEKITNQILRKNYQTYFKNQLFAAKKFKKNIKEERFLKSESKKNITTRDVILTRFFITFPEIFNSDFHLENFVPFSNSEIENECDNLVRSKTNYSFKYNEEFHSIRDLNTPEEAKIFYTGIYNGYLIQKLQKDIAIALQKQDFSRAKCLKDELQKLQLENLKTGT
jgi:DNA primase